MKFIFRIGWQLDMPPVLYYNNDVHENKRIDVHEQTGIRYFERNPAITLPEPACAGGAVWVFNGNGKPFGESAAGAGFFNNRYGADGKSQA